MINYFKKLQNKCNAPDRFIELIEQLFDRLFEFGYINRRIANKLLKRLYNNIDILIIGKNSSYDYKSGYYDAVRKELYLKDLDNIEAVYLRLIYILTTTEVTKNSNTVGYSTASLSTQNYKIIHKDFGINRAVVSNLVCRLLYTVPTTLSIVPTYRAYENDFIGNTIKSDNDIYFLEGKLLSQICFVTGANEESLYYYLFFNPRKYLNRFFNKARFSDPNKILKLFDDISRQYSNYNKLNYLNKQINDNYLEIKKHILDNNTDALWIEQRKIKLAIATALSPLINVDEDYDQISIEASLAEKIDNMESKIIEDISSMQNILVDTIIDNELKYSTISYCMKLKELDDMMVVPNTKLKNKLYEIITHDLLSAHEITNSNLDEKIKYSLIHEILTNEKYIKIYKDLCYIKINNVPVETDSNLVALSFGKEFIQLIKVNNLNLASDKLENNTELIRLENMGYLLNNPTNNKNPDLIEKIYTHIQEKNTSFNNVHIENMFLCKFSNTTLVVILHDNKFSILNIEIKDNSITSTLLKVSDPTLIFNIHDPNSLPTLTNGKKNPFKRIVAILS